MRKVIKITNNIQSNSVGYDNIITIYAKIKDCLFDDIVLDFSKTEWIDANLFALLGALLSSVKELNTITFINLSESLKKVMERSGFIPNNNSMNEKFKTAIQYRKFKISEEENFCFYLENELLSREELSFISLEFKKRIAQKLLEVFSNASQHGNSDFIYICGQCFLKKGKLSLTIVDLGTTVRKNVCSFLQKDINPEESIIWAVDEGNTTRPKSEGIPGGLGLKLLKDFIYLNEGKIQIVSDFGIWELNNKIVKTGLIKSCFYGTLVNIEFNIKNKNNYRWQNETVIEF